MTRGQLLTCQGRQPGGTGFRDQPDHLPVSSSQELMSGAIIRVRRDLVRMPDGDLAWREVVEHPGAVAVLALDDDGRVLLIRQYRHPVQELLWEIPAGLRDVPGEPPLRTAERELREEAGYQAAQWHVLADFFSSPGITTERLRVYLARRLSQVPRTGPGYVPRHEEAHLVVGWLPLEQAAARFLAGDLRNGVTAVGILSAYAALKDGFTGLRGAEAPEC